MSNITIASTTSSDAELAHAVSDNWREPFVPPTSGDKPDPAVEDPQSEVETETVAAKEPAKEAESEKAKEAAKAKPKNGYQKNIDKLTARNHRLAAELEELRAKVAKPAEPTKETAPAKAPAGPPKLADFATPEEWADARDAWKAEEAVKQAKADETKAIFNEYNKAVETAHAKYDDWDDVVTNNNELEIPQAVQVAVIEMGATGTDVAYYLGSHPEVCEELLEMRPLAAVARVHKIAESLKGTSSNSSPKAKPKVAPTAPITPVGGASTRGSVPLDQMSMKEFMAVRNKAEKRR